jgi:hypothetical protein
MPRIDPERSFEVAAKHLFRHINDVNTLRRNPLLRSHFVTNAGDDRTVLARIHNDVLGLSDRFCQELESKGLSLQARRRREIVAALCAGKNAGETAATLRISRSHYYRERYSICSRIARALKRAPAILGPRFVVRDDPLRLVFGRAESLRDAGSSREAVRILEDAYSRVADEFAKSTLGLGLAEELVFFGRRDRATELLARSANLPEDGGQDVASEWLRDIWTLSKARLESQLCSDAAAGSGLERLAKHRIAERRCDDVTFDAVFLSGEGYRNSGRYHEARKMLAHLRALEQRYAQTVAKRQIGVLLLAAYCAESSTDEFGVAEQSLSEARELSISSGTVVGALLATSGLIHHEAARGRDDVVYTMAHEALRLAEGVDFDGFLGYVVAEIIDALLQTRYWRAAAPLVFDAEKYTAPGTARYALLKRSQGAFLIKTGRRNQACAAMLEAYEIAKRIGNRRLEGLLLRDRALALVGPRAAAERAEVMREAVALVECFGSASDLSATYDAATRVLGDRRSLRLAHAARAAAMARSEKLDAPRGRHPTRIEPLRLLTRT